jgi:hypothetical protein
VATRRNEDQHVGFKCGECEETGDDVTWEVEGRFNAAGEFEPFDADDLSCPECGDPGAPADSDVEVAPDV